MGFAFPPHSPPSNPQFFPADSGGEIGLRNIIVLAGLLSAKLLLYIFITPPWQVPDEPTHFEYAYLLFQEKNVLSSVRPDVALQGEILESMKDFRFWSYLHWERPDPLPASFAEDPLLRGAPSQISSSVPLYYVTGALWLRLFSPQTILESLYLLRLFSAVQITLFFLIAALLIKWAIPGRQDLQLGALALIVFLPQLSAMGAGVNSDNAIILTYALVTLICAWIVRAKQATWHLLLLVPAVAVCILSKRTGLAAIPLVAWTIMIRIRWHRRVFIRMACLAVLLILGLAVAQAAVTSSSPAIARKVFGNFAFIWTRLAQSHEFAGGAHLSTIVDVLWKSFWACFGWLTVAGPTWLYWLNLPFLIFAGAGALRTLNLGIRKGREK